MKHILTLDSMDMIDCHLSHMQVLFRSTTVGKKSWLNKDLLFHGVSYLEVCPRFWDEVRIYEGGEAELNYVGQKVAANKPEINGKQTVFVIITNDCKYYISAFRLMITENQMTSAESSIIK